MVACWVLVAAISAGGQTGAETFTATAAVKTAGAAAASAPVTVVISRKMSREQVETLTAAFATGGAAALRKALTGVQPTGSIKLGNGAPTATRLTFERPTDSGRLLTIVADQPIVRPGAGLPGRQAHGGLRLRGPRSHHRRAGPRRPVRSPRPPRSVSSRASSSSKTTPLKRSGSPT